LGTLNLPGGSSAGVRQMFYSGALSVGQGSETNYHTVSIPDLPDAPLRCEIAPRYPVDCVQYMGVRTPSAGMRRQALCKPNLKSYSPAAADS